MCPSSKNTGNIKHLEVPLVALQRSPTPVAFFTLRFTFPTCIFETLFHPEAKYRKGNPIQSMRYSHIMHYLRGNSGVSQKAGICILWTKCGEFKAKGWKWLMLSLTDTVCHSALQFSGRFAQFIAILPEQFIWGYSGKTSYARNRERNGWMTNSFSKVCFHLWYAFLLIFYFYVPIL